MAGLNFPGNACYKEVKSGAVNVASFEIIPWLLGRCATVKEAGKMLENMNITNVSFAEKLRQHLFTGCLRTGKNVS